MRNRLSYPHDALPGSKDAVEWAEKLYDTLHLDFNRTGLGGLQASIQARNERIGELSDEWERLSHTLRNSSLSDARRDVFKARKTTVQRLITKQAIQKDACLLFRNLYLDKDTLPTKADFTKGANKKAELAGQSRERLLVILARFTQPDDYEEKDWRALNDRVYELEVKHFGRTREREAFRKAMKRLRDDLAVESISELVGHACARTSEL